MSQQLLSEERVQSEQFIYEAEPSHCIDTAYSLKGENANPIEYLLMTYLQKLNLKSLNENSRLSQD